MRERVLGETGRVLGETGRVPGETGRVLGETGRVLGVGPYLVIIEDHVHLEGWKHDNRDTGARARHGLYAVAVVMVAMALCPARARAIGN